MRACYTFAGTTFQGKKIRVKLPGDVFNPRLVILIFAINFLLFHIVQSNDNKHVDSTSYILVSGQSNVNEFELIWEESRERSILKIYKENGLLRLSIPYKNFKAKNSLILRDFLDLVEAGSYPEMLISIPDDYISSMRSKDNIINLEILISIAGKENAYNIPCAISECSSGSLHINGSKRLNLTEFGISPPIKLQGLIKVKNEFNVNFGFIITFNESNLNMVKH